MTGTDIPTCRWGIITTGLISSWFVADLALPRPDAKANHVIQAIGTSSLEKGKDFAAKYLKTASTQPTVYATYEEVYADPNVDCVYIGSPHGFHKRDCLAAIAAGKNVLCEKAFTINAAEAREVLDAAKAKGVYVAEAMWLRHRPMVADLKRMLFEEKVIGEVFRVSSDFQMFLDIAGLPSTSRYKDLTLGAGSMLDIGIYPLTWNLLMLDPKVPTEPETPTIKAVQSFVDGIEVTTSVILHYPSTGRQGIILSTTEKKNGEIKVVATIDGTNGFIEVEGEAPSHPASFTVYPKWTSSDKPQGKKHNYKQAAQGFVYEADNTALDIAAGKTESAIMPWAETLRVMDIMDEIRRQGGTKYPQDKA
ncbi:unnamed protein product [Discula destructiva]